MKRIPEPEVLYEASEDSTAHQDEVNWAFDVLFDEVLKRRLKLSTGTLPMPMTVVYN